MSTSEKRLRGMTLLEMMIVLVVGAAVIAMTVPGFVNWNRNERAKAMARSVGDAFALARGESLRTGNQHLVVFNNGTGGSPTTGIAVVDDGPETTANCAIDAGEVIYQSNLAPDVVWGTTATLANGALAPDDEGDSTSTVSSGWSFTQPGSTTAASYVLFRNDGLPRLFTPGGNCASVGATGGGGGGIYLTNGSRDYAVVLQPLGTVRMHRWNVKTGGWTN